MPYYTFKEIWTPLKWIGVRFFRETTTQEIFIKIGSRHRKRLKNVITRKSFPR